MESIVRHSIGIEGRLTLGEFYDNIDREKKNPEFYRKTNLVLIPGDDEYLIMEILGKGGQAYVFLAYHNQKLHALRLSYEKQHDSSIFSTIKKKNSENYRRYFLVQGAGQTAIDFFYLGEEDDANRRHFDREVYVSTWEPADMTLSKKLDVSFGEKLRWFREFLRGLAVIHERDRAHFDIKLENLFLVNDHLKIGDFEFYSRIRDFKQSDILFCGTPGHIAPEIFYDRQGLTTKVDIFSAGITFIRLFTGQRFKGKAVLTSREKDDLNELFQPMAARDVLADIDFRLNFKIYRFYESLLLSRLKSGKLRIEEETLYHLFQKMLALSPEQRPTAGEVLKKVNKLSPVPAAEPAQGSYGDIAEVSTEKTFANSFQKMLSCHDKSGLIKFCLIPDLIETLKNNRIKKKIKRIKFDGDDYDRAFFSFQLLEGEAELQLFGHVISSKNIKKHGYWNMLVIIDYWNRSFSLNLEKPCDKKYIAGLLDAGKLDISDRDLFQSKINETRKKILKLWKKI